MSYDMTPHPKTIPWVFTAPMLAILAAFTFGATGCSMNEQNHSNCLVKEKYYINQQKGDKRIVTSCGNFSVNDGNGAGSHSFDTFAALEIGKRYDIRTNGYRSGGSSSFPNVISYTPR
ncbi:hypothetical protein AB0E01_22825 [Nocardia vinacea]|uniref:hypothetical protein n=1 Tax=Nocardia vinacea TaxID=96468 RepID=UPI0033D5DE9D